jgi:hypothetical protein
MGPGFMPVVPGVVLAFLGILIAGTALGSSEADDCVSPKSLPGEKPIEADIPTTRYSELAG